MTVTTAKMTTFEYLYGDPEDKSGVKKLYRLAEVRERVSTLTK